METKMITIPFNAGLAKKIQEGNYPGSIITRDGNDVRIICWDLQKDHFPIIAVITTDGDEDVYYRTIGGRSSVDNEKEGSDDLVLLVPEWTQFKEGSIITCKIKENQGFLTTSYAILKNVDVRQKHRVNFTYYAAYAYERGFENGELSYNGLADFTGHIRLITEEEKQKFIKRLQEEHTDEARFILKRFFGIEEEEKPECEFEFLQPVLVRDGKDSYWEYGEFTYKRDGIYYVNGGLDWMYCIPYNEQTKHLLGTTDNWEE